MESRFSIQAKAGTHPGMIRTINQDSVFAYVRPDDDGDPLGLLIVADGMGGHQAGDVASQLAVETIRKNLAWLLAEDDDGATVIAPSVYPVDEDEREGTLLEARLKIAIEEANEAIFHYAQSNPTDAGNLGCTVTCSIVVGDLAVVANVGDSRTYHLGKDGLVQITNDHSYVGQMVRDGHLKTEDIYDHPQRNVITRALGSQLEISIDTWFYPLANGDRLFLCSDGVWEMIRDPEELEEILKDDDLDSAVSRMIDAANHYGGTDNIGVVIAELQVVEE